MKLHHLVWLIFFAGITSVTLDARRPASLLRLDEFNSQGFAPRVVSAKALSDTILAGGHDEDDDSDRQTRGRRRSARDQDDDDRDSDGDSDSDDRDRRRRPRWGGFPFPARERNPEARRSPRDRGGYSVEAIASDNGYADGYHKGLEDGRDQRASDPTRHRWYRSADRGYDSRYGSRAHYARIYREAFSDGYAAGYRDGDRNARGRDGRWSISVALAILACDCAGSSCAHLCISQSV